METVGFFYLTADGHFRGSWHEKDPENPRKEYITSFPILKHIPIVDASESWPQGEAVEAHEEATQECLTRDVAGAVRVGGAGRE